MCEEELAAIIRPLAPITLMHLSLATNHTLILYPPLHQLAMLPFSIISTHTRINEQPQEMKKQILSYKFSEITHEMYVASRMHVVFQLPRCTY
jgi:hypothetical protein